jgi:hypothetical protein
MQLRPAAAQVAGLSLLQQQPKQQQQVLPTGACHVQVLSMLPLWLQSRALAALLPLLLALLMLQRQEAQMKLQHSRQLLHLAPATWKTALLLSVLCAPKAFQALRQQHPTAAA